MLFVNYLNKLRLLFVSFLCLLVLGLIACSNKLPKSNLFDAKQKFFELCANGTPEQVEEAIKKDKFKFLDFPAIRNEQMKDAVKRDKIDLNKLTLDNKGDYGYTVLIAAAGLNKDHEVIEISIKNNGIY